MTRISAPDKLFGLCQSCNKTKWWLNYMRVTIPPGIPVKGRTLNCPKCIKKITSELKANGL